MNYIKHLSAFYEKVSSDDRLNTSHISLYMALFQFWNLNHFNNPFSISRGEILCLSKIGSLNTYHKCLHDLHEYGYLDYIPSHNPLKGSLVNLYNFDTTIVQVPYKSRLKIDTSTIQALRHSINSINVLNNKTYREENSQINNSENLNTQNLVPVNTRKTKRKKVVPKKEKASESNSPTGGKSSSSANSIPPPLVEVLTYFKSENFPELEAKKFFNHFQSNGWKVGGKSPMKDWNAAAQNWILNGQLFISKNQPKSKPEPNGKDYSEPL